jgi:peptidoglycan biosynthesis protein MviN/MurJ (putative lipid II flippase)
LIGALTSRIAALHTNHKRILAGAGLIAVLTIVAKLFVAAREMAIAWRLGVSGTVDAYQMALTITTWLPMMAASVMTVVLVPRLIDGHCGQDEEDWFIAELNGTVLLFGVAVAALTFIAAPPAASLLASKSIADTLLATSSMSRQMAPLPMLIIVVGYLSARLQARERFAYSVTEALPGATIAVFVLTSTTAGAGTRLVWGTIIGYALQTLVLAAMIRLSGLGLGSLRLRHRSGRWSSIYGAVLIMAAAQIVLALAIPIDQAFAARLDTGSVATLGYANRIVILATGFGAVVLARALLPVLAAAVAAGDLELGARQARQWAWLLTVVGSLAAAIIWALAGWGVATIFERGAFTSRDSAAVAHLLRFGALQLPFYFGGLALVQWIAAKGRYSALLAIAAVALVSKLVMNFVLVPTLGLEGIMISTVVMYAVSFACQILVAARP